VVKLNRIYTRTGDAGTTGLVDGSRVAKTDIRLAAMGDVDEANSALGMAVVALGAGEVAVALARIQNDLFDLGADLATPGDNFEPSPMALRIIPSQVVRLETEIDVMNDQLGSLTSFILPGGTAAAAGLHLARAITRRAERTAVAAAAQVPINPHAVCYLNRLSDYLFVCARFVNRDAGGDVLWVPGASR